MSSKGRPIHTMHREIRETPDAAEPSYSYEERYIHDEEEDDVEDEFHRRLANNQNRRRSGGAGPGGGGGSTAGGSSNGSFWRTSETTPVLSLMSSPGTGGPGGSFTKAGFGAGAGKNGGPSIFGGGGKSAFPLPMKEISVRERKTSGGLLGAALQLHEGSNNKNSSGGGDNHNKKVDSGARFRRQASGGASSSERNSTGGNNTMQQKKKDVSKARAEARKWKLEAQHSGTLEYGHEEPHKGPQQEGDDEPHNQPNGDAATAGSSDDDASSNAGSSAVNNYKRSSSTGAATNGGNNNYFGKSSSLIFPTGVDNAKKSLDGTTALSTAEAAAAAAASVTPKLTATNSGGSTGPSSGYPAGVSSPPSGGVSSTGTSLTTTIASSLAAGPSAIMSAVIPSSSRDDGISAPSKDTTRSSSTATTETSSNSNKESNNNSSSQKDDPTHMKRHKINLLLDQCETVRFPFKKKLMLNNLHLASSDIPVKDLYGTSLGNSLHKLSLAGNRLSNIPPKLVTCLPVLKTIDLSQCELHQLPERWNLPQLKRLNLSHNRLTDFPEETMLEGLMELQELNMYGNKVSVIVVPHNPKVLAKLESLNLGYNDLAYIPEELDRLKALRVLKVMNNFLEKIPMRVCDMELKSIDVSSNPVIQPPIETCERGICSMKRYYQCLRMEEQNKQKALEALQSKASRKSSASKMFMGKKKAAVMDKVMSFTKTKRPSSQPDSKTTLPKRKSSDESNASSRDDRTTATANSAHSIGTATRSASLSAVKSASGGTVELDAPKRRSAGSLGDSFKRSMSLGEQKAKTEGKPPAAPTVSPPKLAPGVSSAESRKSASSAVSVASAPSVTSIPMDEMTVTSTETPKYVDEVTVNDTLKVIFVGMAMAGKTSMIKRLIQGENAVVPKRDERTVGVDIYPWDTKLDRRFEHIDTRIELQDKELEELCGEVNVKLSVWDFAGQHVYHATHELFFNPRALYVLVWDMAATNPDTKQRKSTEYENSQGAFKLSYDSDDDSEEEDDVDFTAEEEARRADRALERDIDDKVQFWVDCIQSSAPGAAILPVATFDDKFSDNNNQEAKRRCKMLKQRLLKHEARRLQGIKDRLKEYNDSNRANDENAMRLRKLLCSYTRPKLIFGDTDEDCVIRVSGTQYTGFAALTERIINIATNREKGQWRYPIFRGHVGARIPHMRLEVREAVRRMRDRFKVVEWGYFINQLREKGLTSVEDISDALHFLTNIGELSYFGGVLPDRERLMNSMGESTSFMNRDSSKISASDDYSAISEDDDDDDENGFSYMDTTSLTMPSTDDGSLTTMGDYASGLSQFVFLNPIWLVAAVACILRHDLDREIKETRRLLQEGQSSVALPDSFYEVNLNCPVITAEDACMLWQAKKFAKKAAERAEQYSNHMSMKPFEFLQVLLIKFGVFVPIDLGIEKAFLGGVEYAKKLTDEDAPAEITVTQQPDGGNNGALDSTFFFLPSLLGPGEPVEAWTYKSTDSWKATLCHSVLFPDGVPPGLMERITAGVLSNIYSLARGDGSPAMKSMVDGSMFPAQEGNLTVKEVLCWRTAFLVKLGMQTGSAVDSKESIVEVFCGLVDKDSNLCVGSEYMSSGQRRLITSGKGQEGDGGRKIWMGGYRLVIAAVQKVMAEYGGLEYERQAFCPNCLAKKAVGEASSWGFSVVRAAAKNGEATMICRHGHRIDTRLVAGPNVHLQQQNRDNVVENPSQPVVPITDLLRGVVVVGLWDGSTKKVIRVGTGFVADKKRGLIVTASHTLMNIWGDPNSPFGDNYYGLRQGKVVIGVIPRNKGEETGTEAFFRYFAKIVTKDPDIERGVCHLDACVLRITTRMENDVGGTGEGCGDEIERLLLNNPHALKQEKLQQLKITNKCELDEQVRIVGYNQGGEGLLGPGASLNRRVDFARGYVCKKFGGGETSSDAEVRHRFKPREEIVVICPTIGGHSGGPCVNQQGEVIGILSRADPAESQRCYLVPTDEWAPLLREAKHIL